MAHRGGPSRVGTGDDGMTLVESLMSIVLLGIAASGIILGWTTVVSASFRHERQSTVSVLSASASEAVLDQILTPYAPCAVSYDMDSWPEDLEPPPGYEVTITAIEYWDGTDYAPGIANCHEDLLGDEDLSVEQRTFAALQRITIRAATTDGQVAREISVIKRGV